MLTTDYRPCFGDTITPYTSIPPHRSDRSIENGVFNIRLPTECYVYK